MSDKSHSLPIIGESAVEDAGLGTLDRSKQIPQESVLQINIEPSSLPDSSQQSLDDSVFIAIQRKATVTSNANSSKRNSTTIDSVSDCTNATQENENASQFFPSTIITSQSAKNSPSKLFLQPSSQGKDDHYLMWKAEEMTNPKRVRTEENHTIDLTEVDDEQDKNLCMSIMNQEFLTISCKKNRALLYKAKLGSGNKGKCIKFADEWYTPSKFESISGLAMSKDWKRSIRYGGCTMQYLINKGFIRPHAATCTCAVCSEDNNVTVPIRYFTPKLRRKRSVMNSVSLSNMQWEGETLPNVRPMTAPLVQSTNYAPEFVLPVSGPVLTPINNTPPVGIQKPPNFLSLSNSQDNSLTGTSQTEALIQAISENDTSERKLWSQLEEKTNLMMAKLVKLQESISQAKAECVEKRNKLFKQVLSHLEKQKGEQMAYKLDSPLASPLQVKKSMTTSRTRDQESDKLDDEIPEEVSEICRACGRQAISECTGCHKATYCSTECQEKDWHAGHRETCRGLAGTRDAATSSETSGISESTLDGS